MRRLAGVRGARYCDPWLRPASLGTLRPVCAPSLWPVSWPSRRRPGEDTGPNNPSGRWDAGPVSVGPEPAAPARILGMLEEARKPSGAVPY